MSSLSIIDNQVIPVTEYVNELGKEMSSLLGMDEFEGQIYLTLLRTGPITASALAKELSVDRAKTYRVIDKLSNEGFVSLSFSSPKMCIPIDPENALTIILEKKEHEVKKIRDIGKKIIRRVKDTIVPHFGTNVPAFRIIQGTEKIYSNIEKILEVESEIIYIVTTSEDVAKMYHSNIPERISSFKKEGGMVRLIVDADDKQIISFLRRINATETRLGKLPSKGRMVVSKNNQMIISKDMDFAKHASNKSEYAMITNAPEMVDNIFSLCSFLWDASKKINFTKKHKSNLMKTL